jgi:hypothetical protein
MGVWFACQGTVTCRDTKKSRAAVKRLFDAFSADDFTLKLRPCKRDKTFEVIVCGAMHCGLLTVNRIEARWKALGPFVTAPQPIEMSVDDDPRDAWIGNDEDAIYAAKRQKLVQGIWQRIKQLSAGEVGFLQGLIQRTTFPVAAPDE